MPLAEPGRWRTITCPAVRTQRPFPTPRSEAVASTPRRSALWQMAAVERDPRSLFAGAPPPGADAGSPLPELSPLETTLADYRTSGITTGPQIMIHLREELRQRGVRLPVLMMSANASPADKQAAKGDGCDGFLAKPIQWERLLAEIATHLQLQHLQQ